MLIEVVNIWGLFKIISQKGFPKKFNIFFASLSVLDGSYFWIDTNSYFLIFYGV